MTDGAQDTSRGERMSILGLLINAGLALIKLVAGVLERLETGECLSPGGLVYLETARQDDQSTPGAAWELLKDKAVGEVRMRLLKKSEIF